MITHKNPKTGVISTGQHTITNATPTTVNDVNGWKQIMNELNASIDPVISKFNYNAVFEDSDDNNISDVFRFILAVGREYSKTYDFETVFFRDNSDGQGYILGQSSYVNPGNYIELDVNLSSNSNVSGETHVEHFNPTWDDTRVFTDYAEVERSTHITISTDISKFPGRKNDKYN